MCQTANYDARPKTDIVTIYYLQWTLIAITENSTNGQLCFNYQLLYLVLRDNNFPSFRNQNDTIVSAAMKCAWTKKLINLTTLTL